MLAMGSKPKSLTKLTDNCSASLCRAHPWAYPHRTTECLTSTRVLPPASTDTLTRFNMMRVGRPLGDCAKPGYGGQLYGLNLLMSGNIYFLLSIFCDHKRAGLVFAADKQRGGARPPHTARSVYTGPPPPPPPHRQLLVIKLPGTFRTKLINVYRLKCVLYTERLASRYPTYSVSSCHLVV